jgi:acyl-CoA thioesterase
METVAVDVASGRGLVRGLVYTEKGHLLAATQQEGVIRADMGEGYKPTREIERNKGKL